MKINWDEIVNTITTPLVKQGAAEVSVDLLTVILISVIFFIIYFLVRK